MSHIMMSLIIFFLILATGISPLFCEVSAHTSLRQYSLWTDQWDRWQLEV
jgi:hypothetical protein